MARLIVGPRITNQFRTSYQVTCQYHRWQPYFQTKELTKNSLEFYNRNIPVCHFSTFKNNNFSKFGSSKIIINKEGNGERSLSNDAVKNLEAEPQRKRDGEKKAIVRLLTYVTKTYDFLTYPIYTLIQKPWKRIALHKQPKGKRSSDGKYEWTSAIPKSTITKELEDLNIDTIEKMFEHAMIKYAHKKCLGTRPVLSQVVEADSTGQMVKKSELGEYEWMTYKEVHDMTKKLSTSLRTSFGLKPKDTIAIFADTRAEWLMTAMAAFMADLSIATVFTTLGDDGVIHALNQTEVNCVFTSDDLMPRCYELLKHTPLIKNVVYMDRPNPPFKVDNSQLPPGVKVRPWSSLLNSQDGQQQQFESTTQAAPNNRPGPDDTSVIMYTSGSTGTPKGVILTQFNTVSVMKGSSDNLDSLTQPDEYDCYLAFLPLAHILELTNEIQTLMHGAQIAYASTTTITDASPGIKKGTKGDAVAAQPTVMGVVPLVLERISRGVLARMNEVGGNVPDVFNFFCQYKMNWIRKGYTTPLVDKFIFSKTRDLIGGKLRLIVVGGALLDSQTEEFLRTIFCCNLVVGYGLTECAGCASSAIPEDLNVGRSGGPIGGCTFKLVNWEEGGYRVTDKPYPRGELIVGGDSVAKGYFKKTDSTDFFVEDGKRWVKTSDIAEVHDDGAFRIIDRKKDLVKLSTGEFISLGKIESSLKTSSLVENICAVADSTVISPIAIIVPSQIEVKKIAKKLRKSTNMTFDELTQDPEVVQHVLLELQEQARLCKLNKFEIPRAIYLSPTLWLPSSGLVTASLKLKRTNIHAKFKHEIQQLSATVSSH